MSKFIFHFTNIRLINIFDFRETDKFTADSLNIKYKDYFLNTVLQVSSQLLESQFERNDTQVHSINCRKVFKFPF